MNVSIIVAMTPERVIGHDGRLPWHLSADLQRFKRLTMGHPIIMGRKTYDSIGRPLPGRTSIVVSRRQDLVIPGTRVVHAVDEALASCRGESEVFFIGGRQIYVEALHHANRIYRTLVLATIEGDTYFPELSGDQWQIVEEERRQADERNDFDVVFQVLRRAANPGATM